MINSFFKDRDCFTMVRPTENERDLQKLQSMQDGDMRAEFVKQMDLLRSKIFKRVKPKALNKRYITGASLLELCIAYTQAINKGSVPCIESAWTYVCQNENNRAIESAIMAYKKELKELLDDHCPSYDELKESHQETMQKCLKIFKQRAMGEELMD